MDKLEFKQPLVLGNIRSNVLSIMYNVLEIKFRNKKRSGSAILLALMIMSAILSSALFINVLSIRGMRQSQNIDNSIVAFYAAETGNEQAIYYIRKVEGLDVNDLDFPGGSIDPIENLVIRDVEDEVKNILISLKKDEIYQLDIFDQDDIGLRSNVTDLELSWDGDCSNSKIELTVNEWEAEEDINWRTMQDQMHINKCLIGSPAIIDDTGVPCSDIILNGNMSYQFRFKALDCDVHNLNIKAFDASHQQIAFKNIYSIESVGEYPLNTSQSNRQALHVNLRKFSPLSGLFDYVLFSEKSLVKDSEAYTGGWFGSDLFISTDSLPDARVNVDYSYTIRAVNGDPQHYEWSLSGDVPPGPGFEINSSSGVLSGSTTGEGTYLLRITVKDSIEADSKTLFLKVNP